MTGQCVRAVHNCISKMVASKDADSKVSECVDSTVLVLEWSLSQRLSLSTLKLNVCVMKARMCFQVGAQCVVLLSLAIFGGMWTYMLLCVCTG